MSDQVIPLTSDPRQSLTINPVVDGVTLNLRLDVAYSEPAGYWVMRITDASTDEVLVDSLPLITGDYPGGNILGQYGYLKIGSAYIVNASGVDQDHPDETNLGSDFQLIWSDAE